ncbi:alpha/beta hydrolase fold domain-containing protein [Aeromonas sp. 55A]|uniref:alpha/beta hydrolase fold domain-containing protein n=1 Tax=Aeromonas sp. 55A TaxID=3452720 RepID=UPI003F7A58F4
MKCPLLIGLIAGLLCTPAALAAIPDVPMPSDWHGRKIQGPPSGPNSCGMAPDVSRIAHKYLDVPYANRSAAQKMDIYLPDQWQASYPVIINVHGGAFFGCDKMDNQLVPALYGLQKGYAVANINYRLSPEARWPAQIHDLKAAIKFVRAHAKQYSFDPDRIILMGGSAGGHLVALAGVSADVKELEDATLGNQDVSTRVQAVISWYPPINFLTMDAQWKQIDIAGQPHSTEDSFESFLMRKQITQVAAAEMATTNPETYIRQDAPPFMIQHGYLDDTIPRLQSQEFAAKLARAIGSDKVEYNLLMQAKHADDRYFHSRNNLERNYEFLARHLN